MSSDTIRPAACVLAAVTLVLTSVSGACSASDPGDAQVEDPPTTTTVNGGLGHEEWFASNWETKGIRLIRRDGSATQDILSDLPAGAMLVDPDWSPDGNRLVVHLVSDGEATSSILITDLDGADQQTVDTCTQPCVGYGPPSWSRDGTRIVYTRATDTGMTVRVFDLAAATSTDVSQETDEGRSLDALRWSPTGEQLVGVIQQWGPDDDARLDSASLAVTPSSGGPIRQITSGEAFASYPDWHPTQDLIVFATYGLSDFQDLDDHASNLYTVRPDGSDLTQLTDHPAGGPRATQPTWSPDGTFIVFTLVTGHDDESRHLATVAADGTDLNDLGVSGTHNRLRPKA